MLERNMTNLIKMQGPVAGLQFSNLASADFFSYFILGWYYEDWSLPLVKPLLIRHCTAKIITRISYIQFLETYLND